MKLSKMILLFALIASTLISQEYNFKQILPFLGERIDKSIDALGAPSSINCPAANQELKITWVGWEKFALGVDENGTNVARINFFLSNYDKFDIDGIDFTKTTKTELIKKYGNPSEDYTEEYMFWMQKNYILDVWFDEANKPEEVGIRYIFNYKESKTNVKALSELLYSRMNNIIKNVGAPGKVVCPTDDANTKDFSLYWDKFSVSILNKIAVAVHIFYFEDWNEVSFRGIDFKKANKDKIIATLGNKYKEYPEHNLLSWVFEDYNFDVYFDLTGKPSEIAFSQK